MVRKGYGGSGLRRRPDSVPCQSPHKPRTERSARRHPSCHSLYCAGGRAGPESQKLVRARTVPRRSPRVAGPLLLGCPCHSSLKGLLLWEACLRALPRVHAPVTILWVSTLHPDGPEGRLCHCPDIHGLEPGGSQCLRSVCRANSRNYSPAHKGQHWVTLNMQMPCRPCSPFNDSPPRNVKGLWSLLTASQNAPGANNPHTAVTAQVLSTVAPVPALRASILPSSICSLSPLPTAATVSS